MLDIASPLVTPKKVQSEASPRASSMLASPVATLDSPRTAVALDHPAADAQRGQLGNQFRRELGSLPVGIDDGRDFGIDKGADAVAHLALLGRQRPIQS